MTFEIFLVMLGEALFFSFSRRVLEKTSGIEDPGGLHWELFGCLLLGWVIIFLCLVKGIRSTGKVTIHTVHVLNLKNTKYLLINPFHHVLQVVYFTAVFPYVILLALLINNVQLPGATDGILYFVTPVWDKLFEVKVRLYSERYSTVVRQMYLLPRSSSDRIECISQIKMRWECKPYRLAGIFVTRANKMG